MIILLGIGIGIVGLVLLGRICDTVARRVDPTLLSRPIGQARVVLPSGPIGWMKYVAKALLAPSLVAALIFGPRWVSYLGLVGLTFSMAYWCYVLRLRPLLAKGASSSEAVRLFAFTALWVLSWGGTMLYIATTSHHPSNIALERTRRE
jgi:hypothetical protein